ncbi:transferase [Rhodococcus sp. H36-A4]|uniref:transferase n=1 Tax=Rhodococcus sp. H36-A4 TaxID=3004353 RepID=UPI0022AF4291|nr:transferase [Rhodococcus sp. H36-A4]MCZ4078929.1 transferase [Rhodococcus sp. H36-A4]
MVCRGCSCTETDRVLDLGRVPATDCFPLASTPISSEESVHPLAMALCRACGLAQLADDDTTADEPRGVEPQALKDQAAQAVRLVSEAGALTGDTVIEFGSPHGGSWLPLLAERGLRSPVHTTKAAVVVDCFGAMHEPDQRAAFRQRAAATADDGVLLIQFHSLRAIVGGGQWNALRHGHFAYYSLTVLSRLLEDVGMFVTAVWEFDLYGGTVLVAARHRPDGPLSADVRCILTAEHTVGLADPVVLRSLQRAANEQTAALHEWLTLMARRNLRIFAYGAASRAVPLFAKAGVDRTLVTAVADVSHAKQTRRMPGTDVPIISPEQLVEARPDHVLLTLPELLPEVQRRIPALTGRWMVPPTHAVGDGFDAYRTTGVRMAVES